jgi:hypothetical protein
MDKKPLIGVSICAVVLLVLGSLTNVVGYQSVKSTVVNDSPLFSVRTQRATNQPSGIVLTSDYLGEGTADFLQFPLRDNKTESLKRAIEIMSKMDAKAFARITALYIQKAKQDKTLKNTTSNEFAQLKSKLEAMIHPPNTIDVPTICFWFPGCIPVTIAVSIIYSLFLAIVFIAFFIYEGFSVLISCAGCYMP